MPTLRPPVTGSRVITDGSVMYGPPSSGQHCMIGSRSRSGSVITTSWQAPEPTIFGFESFSVRRPVAAASSTAERPFGGCSSSNTPATRSRTSSSDPTPSARHIRRSVPNWLISTGIAEPLTLRNSSAGPPAFMVRSAISVISRCGSTSAVISASSPSRRSSSIQSRRSFIARPGRAPARARPPRAPTPSCRRSRPRERRSETVAISSASVVTAPRSPARQISTRPAA